MNEESDAVASAAAHALVAAAAVGALEVALTIGLAGGPGFALLLLVPAFAFALALASFHMVVALPAYLLLSRLMRVGRVSCAIAGFLIGWLPGALLGAPWAAGGVGTMLAFGLPGLAGGVAFAQRLAREQT
ncbi:MAG TPA: hypothetical protein VGB08_05260 [Allosphingosinicella sp.]|jgi:hypothetical protein